MTDIGLGHYLSLGAIIFTIGIVGIFLNRKNIIVILMSIELILLAVNINLVSFSKRSYWSSFYSFYINCSGGRGGYRFSYYCGLLQKLWNNKSRRNR